MNLKYFASATAVILIAACSNPSADGQLETNPTENSNTNIQNETKQSVISLEITGDDQMQFDKKELVVKAGSVVKLTFTNVGELPVEAMGHNWTLLAKNVDLVEYAQAAMLEKDNDYQVSGREADVLAKTRILGPGESETIEFPAPEKGTYAYVCTFPGHFGMMRGSFIVR